jgi:hypothetical protein
MRYFFDLRDGNQLADNNGPVLKAQFVFEIGRADR